MGQNQLAPLYLFTIYFMGKMPKSNKKKKKINSKSRLSVPLAAYGGRI
jgi:hypothetical protein